MGSHATCTASVQSEYSPREYIVQHRETDLDFVARLLAEHGLWYYSDIRLSRDRETNSEQEAITSLGASDRLRTTDLRIRHFGWTIPSRDIDKKKALSDAAGVPLARYEHGDVTSLDYKDPQYRKDDVETQAQSPVCRSRPTEGGPHAPILGRGTRN